MEKSILIIFVILQVNLGFCQEKLTYKDCVNLAVKNNLSIKSASISEKIAVYKLRTNVGQLLPIITGNVDNKYSWGREIDPTTNAFIDKNLKAYTGNMTGLLTLFSGFYNLKAIKSAKQEVEINKAFQQKIQNEITIELSQIFIEILYFQELIVANKEQILGSEKQLEFAKLKFDSGVIAESEVFKIQSQKASEELVLVTNQNRLIISEIALKQLLNIPLEKKIELIKPAFLVSEKSKTEENEYEITKKAVAINPSYSMNKWIENKAKTEIALARSAKMPILNLKYTYGSNFSDSDPLISYNDQIDNNLASVLKLSLIVPIFNQFETTFKIKQNKLSFEQAKLETKMEENRLSKVILQAINDTKAANKKQETATIAFEFAKKSYEADLLKYELGKINSNEFNFTKSNYINAQVELINSKYEQLFNTGLLNFYLGEDFSM
ncbi:TolC Outer membrane protein [Flavobacteriaceae bacterium]